MNKDEKILETSNFVIHYVEKEVQDFDEIYCCDNCGNIFVQCDETVLEVSYVEDCFFGYPQQKVFCCEDCCKEYYESSF